LLDDLRDNTASSTSAYSRELDERLETSLQGVIDRSGLTGYSESSLKRLLLKFIQQATQNDRSVHKYNTIGRGVIGDFERWTQTTLTSDEKESLIWVWGELLRLRLIAPTGTDLVDPDSWVKLTKTGIEAVDAKELNEQPPASENKPPSQPIPVIKQVTDKFEYDIAISFAGEQRSEAEGIAECLRNAAVKVFYDKYEQSDLWGKDLYAHLADIYQKKARYCLMLVSANYAAKVWTNHERRSAQARALSESKEYILPVRFNDTEIPGLLPTIGHLRFEEHGVEGICRLLLEKLGVADSSSAAPAKKQAITASDPSAYWAQRKQLPDTDIYKKILSKPRWCIWIRPTEFKPARFQNLDQCKTFMLSRFVRVPSVGSYPWVTSSSIETGNEWIACEIDATHHLERWNLFRSGQFVHYRTLEKHSQIGERTHALEILDIVTQAFEFAARLAHEGVLSQNADITFDLLGVSGRALTWPKRSDSYGNDVPSNCWSPDENIRVEIAISSNELESQRRELALGIVMEIYARFGWSDPPRERLLTEQGQRYAVID